jgi:hypothetical protein
VSDTSQQVAGLAEACNYKVTFAGVGRAKKSWVSTLDHMPSEDELVKFVRKAKALGSNDIECVFDEDLEHGIVVVGGFRPVGAFRVEEVR